jgi:hypothetical protein
MFYKIKKREMNKSGQMFLLSAVLILAVIIGLATTKNYVSAGDSSKEFFYDSQQLRSELGAIIDYALYNNSQADLSPLFNDVIALALSSSPEIEIVGCYTLSNSTKLICQNNASAETKIIIGENSILLAGKNQIVLAPNKGEKMDDYSKERTVSVDSGKELKMIISDKEYSFKIIDNTIQKNQFYFLFKISSKSGEYIDLISASN